MINKILNNKIFLPKQVTKQKINYNQILQIQQQQSLNNIILQKFSQSPYKKYKEIEIPKHLYKTKFSRCSGPGGQNVNKVNSKAEIKFEIDSAYTWLDEETINKLKLHQKNHINHENEIVIQSQTHRTQDQNLKDCIEKLQMMIYDATLVEKERRYDIPAETESLARKRIDSKRKKSSVKKTRQNRFD